MHVTAKAEYAIRALIELARNGRPASVERLSSAQGIPHPYLSQIMATLKRAGLIYTVHGPDGGYQFVGDPSSVSMLQVITALDGPPTTVRGQVPEDLDYVGSAQPLRAVWAELSVRVQEVLGGVTIGELAARGRMQPLESIAR